MTEETDIQKIREKKMREAYAKMQQQAEMERQMNAVAITYLEPAAYERLGNVKLSTPGVYQQVINILATYGKQMKRKLTEEELLSLLREILPKKETKIYIKRKGGDYGEYKR